MYDLWRAIDAFKPNKNIVPKMVKIEIDRKDFDMKMQKALKGMAFDLQEALKGQLGLPTDPTNTAPYGGRGKFTGKAQSSIIGKVEGDTVSIEMPGYMQFLEFGTPHTVNDIDALKDWVRLKMLAGQSSANKEKTVDKITKNVMDKIQRQGPVPFPFIRHVYNTQLIKIINNNLIRSFS